MSAQILTDNWALQNVGQLLQTGLTGDTAHEIAFSSKLRTFKYEEVPLDVVHLECLFQLLQNVVFAETIHVDSSFTDRWLPFECLQPLRNAKVVIGTPFKTAEDKWVPCREAIVEELCFCPAVRKGHQKNVDAYAAKSPASDRMLEQLVWGGAGMLARAECYNLAYAPHPLRGRFFAKAKLNLRPLNAEERLKTFVDSERLKIYQRIDGTGFYSHFRLPPVAARILNEADCVSDLITVALQERGQYSELRGWLAEFQKALHGEDVREILAREKIFQSISRYIDAIGSYAPVGDTTIQFGLSWLKVTTKGGSPLNSIRNRFGVRAQINRMVFAPAGRNSFKKLLKILDQEHSRLGRELEKEFFTV